MRAWLRQRYLIDLNVSKTYDDFVFAWAEQLAARPVSLATVKRFIRSAYPKPGQAPPAPEVIVIEDEQAPEVIVIEDEQGPPPPQVPNPIGGPAPQPMNGVICIYLD